MYVKNYENGVLLNPITKENPFINKLKSKKVIDKMPKDGKLIVSYIGKGKFVKYRVRYQKIGNKEILHYDNKKITK